MKFGEELIKSLEHEIETLQAAIDRRWDRIYRCETDMDDCFISERVETRAVQLAKDKIALIRSGGTEWFLEYATEDNKLVNAKWCNTRYGSKLRIVMPDGKVIWTTGGDKALKRLGLKKVLCRRPAWYCFSSPYEGMLGVYSGSYELFPSAWNYATGEEAYDVPLEMKDVC